MPKASVQSVLRPMVKLVSKANVQSVHSLRVNGTVNIAGNKTAHNQSASSAKGINSAPKLVVRKDRKGVPTTPPGIGDNNKSIPKVSASKPPDPEPSVQEDNSFRRSTRDKKTNKKYLDISSFFTGFSFWNSKSSFQSDIHTVRTLSSN